MQKRGYMSKSDDKAQLDALLAQFKGEIKRVPAAVAAAPKGNRIRRKAKPNTCVAGEMSAAEGAGDKPSGSLDKWVSAHAPTGSDVENIETDLGRSHTYVADSPTDGAHRHHLAGELGRLDSRSRAYVEMMIGASDDDDDDEHHHYFSECFQSPEDRKREALFRAAAASGGHCAECGKTLAAGEPVWRVRRKLEGKNIEIDFGRHSIYETEEVIAPICGHCWRAGMFGRLTGRGRVTLTQECHGCGRPVHVTPKALKSWLRHGRRAYCCEDCTRRPPAQYDSCRMTRACAICGKDFELKRLDAMFCGAACRQKASRARKKVGPAA
jgi:hypothetical protein